MGLYKRNLFLINKPFQIKFSLVVCSLVLVSTIIYPFTIMELFESFVRINPAQKASLEESKVELVTLLALYQVLLVGIIFIISIFLTHKIAGPMYKVMNYFQSIRNGNPPKNIAFRNGDYFPEVATEINRLFDHLAESRNQDLNYLQEVIGYINNLALIVPEDKKPVIQEITTRLNEIQSRLKIETSM